jgi:hypothetical protein
MKKLVDLLPILFPAQFNGNQLTSILFLI